MSWMVCDCRLNENPCLYSERAVFRLRSDPSRCIKHGALLFYHTEYDGMSRAEIRKAWKEATAEAPR